MFMVNVGKYTSPMDPMGVATMPCGSFPVLLDPGEGLARYL